MIDEAIAEVVNSLPENALPIAADLFELHLDGKVYHEVKAELYADCIILRVNVFFLPFRNSQKTLYSRSASTSTLSSSS